MTAPTGEGTKPAEGAKPEGDDTAAKLTAAEKERDDLKTALDKANKDAARNRRRAAKAGAGNDADPDDEDTDPKDGDSKSDAELKRLRRETAELRRETRENKAMDALGDAIEEAGGDKLTRAALRRHVKMLDSLKPDELDDAIEALRDDLPHLFEKKDGGKPPRKRAPNARTGTGDSDNDGESAARGANLSESTRRMLKANGLL